MACIKRVRAASLAAAVVAALAAAGCGREEETPRAAQFERVRFRAADGVRLDGRLYGAGRVGVVLVHMGRDGDSQLDWRRLAKRLGDHGYLVLTYDRRGVCPGGPAGCSGGVDDYTSSWRDVVGAARFLRRRGASRTVIVGASIGAMSSLYAASRRRVEPEALIEFAGINHASGYDFDRAQIRRIGGAKLFLSSRDDIYGGGDAAGEWYRWASRPKRLELVPGSDHGTDLLQPSNPQHERVEQLIVDFIGRAVPA